MRPRSTATTRATMKDVAERAGVSKATVSRVLNGSDLVTPQTRQQVEEAMSAVGYVVSHSARSLAMGRTDAVALLVTEPLEQLWSDPTFSTILGGAYSALSPTALTPILLQATTAEERVKVARQIEQGVADGVIHLTPYLGNELLDLLAGLTLPVVLCGRLPGDPYHGRFSTVYADDVLGAAQCAELIAARGRSQPIALLGPRDNPASVDRLTGYRSVFGSALSDDRVRFNDWDEYGGASALQEITAAGVPYDAVLCGSDRIALGVLGAACRGPGGGADPDAPSAARREHQSVAPRPRISALAALGRRGVGAETAWRAAG